jgi:hypothetical protein
MNVSKMMVNDFCFSLNHYQKRDFLGFCQRSLKSVHGFNGRNFFLKHKITAHQNNYSINFYKNIKVLIGCYPTDQTWIAFNDGITGTLISQIPGISSTYLLVNGFYMFQLANGMTVESCTKICFANTFLFSGIGGLGLFHSFCELKISFELVLINYFNSGCWCECGNSLRFNSVSTSMCISGCNGNSKEACGGSTYFSVYTIPGRLKIID